MSNILSVSARVSGELYIKHKGEFNCVRKYDQASGEDFLLNIDFEIDIKKSEGENKEGLIAAVTSYLNAEPVPMIVDDSYLDNTKMPY